MARQIAIREEYLKQCDEATLQAVLKMLSKEFLLLPLDDYCIEVAEQDYAAVSNVLEGLRREVELNNEI